MDFHSLSRRSLQFLCKRNGIPANLKNVAMADALSSLHSVDGLDELIQWQQTPSPTYKPRNPVRSCRKASPSVGGGRALAPKQRCDLTAGGGPNENLTPSSYLLSCSEKALCLKHMYECTQTVRGNVLQVETRNGGVQVDTEERNQFVVGKLETNRLDFDDCDEVLGQGEENELPVVCEIKVSDTGRVDASLRMQKVQDSSNLSKPITNSMDQKPKIVNDDVEIVTDERTIPTSEPHVKICMEASTLANVQVNSTSQESGLKSMSIPCCEWEISSEGIDLDPNLNTIPQENVLGGNMDHSNKETEHMEEMHGQNLIQDDEVYLKGCNDTSSLQNAQEAALPQMVSPKTYKPHNPVRSCRKASPSVGDGCALASKQRCNLTAGGGPNENLTASSYLLSCSEKALCLKHMYECTQTVRGNVLQVETRNVGIQVDTEERNQFVVGKLETNRLDFEDCDEVLGQDEENELPVVCEIKVSDTGSVDASLRMQKVQDSSNSSKPITNSMDQKPKIVNDDVEIVTDERTIPTSEPHVKICMKASSLANVQVNSTSQDSGLKSMSIPSCEWEISSEGIDLDPNLNTIPQENVLGDNMDHSNKEIEHMEEMHGQNLIQDDEVYLKGCNDTSSLQNAQEAALPQMVSPKNIFEASSTIDVESVNCLGYDRDEEMSSSGILNKKRQAEDMKIVNVETHFETIASNAEDNRCLGNIKEVQEATPSFTTEANKLNTSFDCSVSAKNEVDGRRECSNVQVTTSLRSPSLKGVTFESDINVGSDSVYVKDCSNASALQNVQANATAQELDLKSTKLCLYDQQTSVPDIDLNSPMKSDKNERGGSSGVPCKHVSPDSMDVLNEDSELNVETHSQSLIQEDQDIHSKDVNDASCLQHVQIAAQLQIPSPENIILEAPSVVANNLMYSLKCDRDEKMQHKNFTSESRKTYDMGKANKETHFETMIISDTEAHGCLDNVKEVEEADSVVTSGVHELNVSMVCSVPEHDDVLAKNDEDGERKCSSVQVITTLERPSPKCIIFEPDSNVDAVTVFANGCIGASTVPNDEVNSLKQEADLESTNLSLHGQQISIGGNNLNLAINSDKNERGGSSSLGSEGIKVNIYAPNEENEHDEERKRQHFIQKDQDINVKESYGTSSLQNIQISTLPETRSPNRIILVADRIVGIDSVHNMERDRDRKMLSSDSSILSESVKVDRCLDNVKEAKDSFSLSSSKIQESNMSMVCSAVKPNALLKNGDVGERKCKKGIGEGMLIEINKEPHSSKKRRRLSDLSLRKLRLMYKENKEVIKLKMERDTERDMDIRYKEETSNKEESANISCKEEPGMKEESGGTCWKEETNKKEEFGDMSLRKLKFMLKNMAKKH